MGYNKKDKWLRTMARNKKYHIYMINIELQLCLNEIQRWADANGLKFSMSKSVCFHFCNVHTPHPEPNFTINAIQTPF